MFRFADPWFFVALPIIGLLLAWHLSGRRRLRPTLTFSWITPVAQIRSGSPEWSQYLLIAMRVLAVVLVVVALARPQSGVRQEQVKTEGIDIVLALDISSSMLAEDISPNRVEAAKQVAAEFVKGRFNDRISLVVFAGQAYTQCPLTLDYGILVDLLDQVSVGMVEDGTAIGMGLGVAVNRLRGSDAKSKVIILLTDGKNNRGEIDPKTASELARTFEIRIYTIGAGSQGMAPYPVDDPMFGRRYVQVQVDIDEAMLKEVAANTGGRYFRATDRDSLTAIYKEIDQLEKTEREITEFTRYSELFHYPMGVAIMLICLEILFWGTRFRRIP